MLEEKVVRVSDERWMKRAEKCMRGLHLNKYIPQFRKGIVPMFCGHMVMNANDNPKVQRRIEWLRKKGELVYAVEKSVMMYGDTPMGMLNFLCVHNEEDYGGYEFIWKGTFANTKVVDAYCSNLTIPDFSEFGSVEICMEDGKIFRCHGGRRVYDDEYTLNFPDRYINKELYEEEM